MWARRCGAPPKWPSRVKVMVHSFFIAALGLTLYKFMQTADVNYLDIDRPLDHRSICLTRWPLRYDGSSWFDTEPWVDWYEVRTDMALFMEHHQCSASSNSNPMAQELCTEMLLPLKQVQRHLGVPITRDERRHDWRNDVLELYSHLFLILSGLMWVTVLFHDLTLLSGANKDFVLDWLGVRRRFPRIVKVFKLTGFVPWLTFFFGSAAARRSRRARQLGAAIGIALAPLVALWALGVLLFIVVPTILCCFLLHPLRLSRVSLFLICMSLGIYGLVLSFHSLCFVIQPDMRPSYAVTWAIQDDTSPCICGCAFPMSKGGCGQILLMGIIVTFQAFMLGFRCLKGLRRSNWANLMSVTFAIPLTVYAVEWLAPDGSAIKYRKDGEPVQGEPAFDPFAMMDEQPNSAKTTVHLFPVHMRRQDLPKDLRNMEGPRLSKASTMAIRKSEEVGCCGFPCRIRDRGIYMDEAAESDCGAEDSEAVMDLSTTLSGPYQGGSCSSLSSGNSRSFHEGPERIACQEPVSPRPASVGPATELVEDVLGRDDALDGEDVQAVPERGGGGGIWQGGSEGSAGASSSDEGVAPSVLSSGNLSATRAGLRVVTFAGDLKIEQDGEDDEKARPDRTAAAASASTARTEATSSSSAAAAAAAAASSHPSSDISDPPLATPKSAQLHWVSSESVSHFRL